jgi:hypothetical protein
MAGDFPEPGGPRSNDSGGTEGVRHRPVKRNRAVTTRYDKLAVRHEATVHIAAINEWLPTNL